MADDPPVEIDLAVLAQFATPSGLTLNTGDPLAKAAMTALAAACSWSFGAMGRGQEEVFDSLEGKKMNVLAPGKLGKGG